ncbi:MAG: ABC-type multidrug transport system, ATPase component [halophilic archaeon J07HB67]|nr:MAG: ABC-type multidrug transport system, ATPase component [halophilic archaeon J07HB67]
MKLELNTLGKQYGDTWALQSVDLELDPGVVGLLGPNGAGKSTLMQIVTTFTTPTEGTVLWNGTDIVDSPGVIREDIGYLPQEFGVYPSLTAREFLEYLAAVRGLSRPTDRIEQLLDLVNLGDDADRHLGGFSGGMRRRVGIAQALLSDPDLLIVTSQPSGWIRPNVLASGVYSPAWQPTGSSSSRHTSFRMSKPLPMKLHFSTTAGWSHTRPQPTCSQPSRGPSGRVPSQSPNCRI